MLPNCRTTLVFVFALAYLSSGTESFSSPSTPARFVQRQTSPMAFGGRKSLVVVRDSTEESVGDDSASASDEPTKKVSLEEKMKSWEASEEEIRAASLGGVVPQGRERTEAFDVGLYIAFPIMVLTGLAFAFFPFIMGSIDVSDVVVPTK